MEIKVLPNEFQKLSTLGDKRNQLLDMATGDYLCFVDDDDMVPPYYVDSLLEAIHEHSPDVVGWWMARFEDGKMSGYGIYSTANRYFELKFDELRGYKKYLRTPTHLNAVKSELAKDTAFKAMDRAEDVDYARRLLPKLKTEYYVDKMMYEYYLLSSCFRPEKRLKFDIETEPIYNTLGDYNYGQ